jgi:hypothetical protein
MKMKKETRPLIYSFLVRGRARADKPGGAIEINNGTITRNANDVHCSCIIGAATK